MRPRHETETLYQLPTYSPASAQGIFLAAALASGLDLLASLLAAASCMARAWGGSPRLGEPWLRLAAYPRPDLLGLAGALCGALLLAAAACCRRPGGREIQGGGATGRRAATALLLATAPLLLPALVVLGLAATGPLYPPLSFARWSTRYAHLPALALAVDAGRRRLFATLGPLLAITAGAAALRLGALRETGDTHGSSHWATPREVAAAGLLQPPAPRPAPAVVAGAWHGRAPGQLRARLHRLSDCRDRHVLAFAPSGSGKTTCLVIPTLFTWSASVIVLDIKGELWHRTAGYRRAAFRQPCLRLDLAAADGTAAAYNPLALVPRGPGDVKHAQGIADVLVDPEGRSQARGFWEESAHALLTALVLHVVHAEEEKTLATCARLLADPGRPLQETLEMLLAADHDRGDQRGWLDPHTGTPIHTHPAVAAAARALLDMDPRTASGIVATAQAHLGLFRDPILAANLARADFFPLDLVAGETPVSLYLTLAPADLDRLRGPVRLILNQLCRALTEKLDFAPDDSRPGGRHPLLLLLDEFTVLGKLDFFGRAMAYLRGYGIRVYISIQSLTQLHDIYGPHQSITANCPLQIAFAPADLETAELLSRLLGPTTVHLARRAVNNAPLALGPRRQTLTQHELARPLLTAEEVRRLPEGEALLFAAGHAPIRARRLPYYRDAELAEHGRLPPPPRSDRIR
jgi:type IV secretion system protein VirD4